MPKHSLRKVSIAAAALAAEACRHLATTAWTSGRSLPCDARVTALVSQLCSESLISTSLAWSRLRGPTSSGSRDDIERFLPSRQQRTVRAQHSLTSVRCGRTGSDRAIRGGDTRRAVLRVLLGGALGLALTFGRVAVP